MFEVIDETQGLIACLECYDEYRKGFHKIKDDVAAELKRRAENWRNEWRRNFKREK
jgi:hypothetical protein